MIAQDLLGKQTSARAVGTHNMGIVFAQTLNMFIRNKPLSFLKKKKKNPRGGRKEMAEKIKYLVVSKNNTLICVI